MRILRVNLLVASQLMRGLTGGRLKAT